MRKRSKETIIGIVTIVSLSLLYFGLNYLKGINLFNSTNSYYARTTEAFGVEVSTPIYVEGFKVGLVRAIEYNYDDYNDYIFVKIDLDKKMKIPKESKIIFSSSFLNGGSLLIQLNKTTHQYLQPGDTIEAIRQSDMMQQVEQSILPDLQAMLHKIDSILTGVNVLVQHPALAQSLTNIQNSTRNLETATIRFNQMMVNDVPKILNNINTITEDFSVTSGRLKQIEFATTFHALDSTINNLQTLTNNLNRTDNTIGLLLNDPSLYNNLDSTAANANLLLIDFKKNPKRYVRFSVF